MVIWKGRNLHHPPQPDSCHVSHLARSTEFWSKIFGWQLDFFWGMVTPAKTNMIMENPSFEDVFFYSKWRFSQFFMLVFRGVSDLLERLLGEFLSRAMKKVKTYSPKWWFDGDESHGRICKKSPKKTNPRHSSKS